MSRICIAVLALSASRIAIAQAPATLEGMQVVWAGSGVDAGSRPQNLNQLFISPGQLVLGLGFFYVIGGGGVTLVTQTVGASTQTSNFSFSADVPGLAQAANTPYYVYAAVNYGDGGVAGGVLQYVISITPPNPGGDPSAFLTWTPDGGGKFTTGLALFLGSYVTDTNASTNMVPFLRNGDQTILTPLVSTNSAVDSPWIGSVDFTHNVVGGTGHYPWVQDLVLVSGCTQLDAGTCAVPPIPKTASALLIDFQGTNSDVVSRDVRILNPGVPVDDGNQCASPMQYAINIDPSNIQALTTYDHARIKTAINTYVDGGSPLANPLYTMSVAGCTQPNGAYSLTAVYAGYVEVPHHIGL